MNVCSATYGCSLSGLTLSLHHKPHEFGAFIVSLWSLLSVTTPPSYGGHYGPFALAFRQRGGPTPRRRPPPN